MGWNTLKSLGWSQAQSVGMTKPVWDVLADKFYQSNGESLSDSRSAIKDFKAINDRVDAYLMKNAPDAEKVLDHHAKKDMRFAAAMADWYLYEPKTYEERMMQVAQRIKESPDYATELTERLKKEMPYRDLGELDEQASLAAARKKMERERSAPAAQGQEAQSGPVQVASDVKIAVAPLFTPFEKMKTAEESLAEYEKMKADDPAFAQKFKSVDDTIKAALKQHPGQIEMLAKKEEREKLEAELAKSPAAFKTAFAGPAGQGDILSSLQSLKDIPIIGGLIQGIMQMFEKTPDGGTGMAIGDLGQALMGAFTNMFGGSQVGQVMAQRGQEQLNGKKVDSPNAKLGANVLQGDALSIADRAALGRSDVTVSVIPAGNQGPATEFNGLLGMVTNLLPGVSTAPAPVVAKAPERREPLQGALPEPAPTWGHATSGNA